ncbi:MAG: PLP-dependent aminotransferase family protein [Acidobacteria bacterium]|nr:PLP-dependent aminotransferase family protein [Acidobacteriota bacterium]
MTDYDEMLSTVGRHLRPNEIRKLTSLLGRGEVISFAAGAPSAETFPLAELTEIAARVVREHGKFALQYGPTKGSSTLIDSVVSTMQKRGVHSSAAAIILTTGSQQGLDLVSRLLMNAGDVALVELPSYVGGTIALHNAQARLIGVRQDQGGLVLADLRDKLEAAQAAGQRVKCLYTIPNFQNPSGVSLALERRAEIVRLAEAFDFLILEDDPYFELYFDEDRAQRTPLAALNPERVIYLSSFSKVLAPGLRTAWVQAPPALAAKLELLKEGADLSSSVFDQAIVALAVREGLVENRLPMIREFYRVRREAMLTALEQHAPPNARWTKPTGGFFLWMEVAKEIDAKKLLPTAIESGVAYVPGQPFFVDDSGANTLRLAYSKETPEAIATGIARLCSLLHSAA